MNFYCQHHKQIYIKETQSFPVILFNVCTNTFPIYSKGLSHSMWVSMEPQKTGNLWYENLDWIVNKGTVLNIQEHAIENAAKGKCLTMTMNKDIDTSNEKTTPGIRFTMKSVECAESHLAVCKLEQDREFVSPDPPPQFPCISKSDRRKKRESKDESGMLSFSVM